MDTVREALRVIETVTAAAADAAAVRGGCRRVGCLAALATAAAVHGQTVLFVDDDAPAGGDGQSWQTAYAELQDALEFVKANQTRGALIRIAGGTYTPSLSDPSTSFEVGTSGVTLMGGFAGIGHPDPNRLDPDSFATVLTGDLRGDDGPNFANRADNAGTVIRVAGGDIAYLGNLVIQGGSSGFGTAAGVDCIDPQVRVVLYNCTVTENLGAAISARNLTLQRSRVEANSVLHDPVISGSYIWLIDSTVRGNVSRRSWNRSVTAIGVDRGDLTIDQSLVVGAGDPAIDLHGQQPVIHCNHGGIIARNSTLVAGDPQQPIFFSGLHAVLVGSIVATATEAPARLAVYPLRSLAVFHSCIHVDSESLNSLAGALIIADRVLIRDPRFADRDGIDNDAATQLDNDFSLAPGSPAIDIGDARAITLGTTDLLGRPRLHDDAGTPNLGVGSASTIDLGPFEFQGVSCRVDLDRSGAVGTNDVLQFLTDWLAASPEADFNRSSTVELQDLFDFVIAYFSGCA